MTLLLEGLIIALALLAAARVFVRVQNARDEHRQAMLEESWAIYRASRRIHDQTTAALQEMLDAARANKYGGE